MEIRSPLRIRAYKFTKWSKPFTQLAGLDEDQNNRSATFRKVRLSLVRKQPLVLQTPRWSAASQFTRQVLDRMNGSDDKNKGYSMLLGVSSQDSLSENWYHAIQDLERLFFEDNEGSKTLSVMTERKAFRWKLVDIFTRISHSDHPPSVIVFQHVERLSMSIVEDLQLAWLEAFTGERRGEIVPVVLSGAIEGGHFSNSVWLRDYCIDEATELFGDAVETNPLLQNAIVRSGGIPALIHALLDRQNDEELSPEAIDAAWLPIAKEMRQVIDLVAAKRLLCSRLQTLADHVDGLPFQEIDTQLAEAGLVRQVYAEYSRHSRLRGPFLAELL